MIRLNTVAANGLCVRTRMCIQFDFLDADGSGEIDAGELQGWGCCPSHVCFCSDSPVLSTQILLLPLASHLAAAM